MQTGLWCEHELERPTEKADREFAGDIAAYKWTIASHEICKTSPQDVELENLDLIGEITVQSLCSRLHGCPKKSTWNCLESGEWHLLWMTPEYYDQAWIASVRRFHSACLSARSTFGIMKWFRKG